MKSGQFPSASSVPSSATVGRARCLSQLEPGTHLTQPADWAAAPGVSQEQLKPDGSNPISKESHSNHRWGHHTPPPLAPLFFFFTPLSSEGLMLLSEELRLRVVKLFFC